MFLSPTYALDSIKQDKKKDNVFFSVMHSFCSQKKILGMILSTGALSSEAIIIYLILKSSSPVLELLQLGIYY